MTCPRCGSTSIFREYDGDKMCLNCGEVIYTFTTTLPRSYDKKNLKERAYDMLSHKQQNRLDVLL